MKNTELIVFIVYLLFMLSIGIFFFVKDKKGGEKSYFLGNRQMGPWVTALSAGASDMSAWVLMGLPTAVYALGMGQIWIPVGLAIGYTLSWLLEAPRLRKFSIVANDSITIPQYLTNRFLSKSKILQVICAIVFLLAYTIYAASSVKACGTLFNTVVGIDEKKAMYLAAAVIISYTFLGGFSAVCWTDFFQGLLILAAMFTAPLFAVSMLHLAPTATIAAETPGYWDAFNSWKDIASGLGWGIGYFGMPHIIIRFMSLKSQKECKKSATIGITWTFLILIFAALIGVIGRLHFGYDESIDGNSLVFISMVREIFAKIPVISGILLAAVLAASMSTADSQLLAASSAFSSDVYSSILRKNKASAQEMKWIGRIVVLLIAVVALIIASNPNSGSIMDLVSNAWGVFGAAFGPVIMLSLFWKRFNFAGATAGIIVGAAVDIVWFNVPKIASLGIYEIIPGALAGLFAAVFVTLLTKTPSAEVEQLFDDAVAYEE